MPTILVKGLPEETVKRLKKLKIELDCNTWAELLEKLSAPQLAKFYITRQEISEMRKGVIGFSALSNDFSKKWKSSTPAIVEEFRKSRRHA